MPNWAIHLLVPLLVLLIVGRKEDYKYILLLLPFAVLPDIDTFATEHRALLHNIFIPLALVLIGISLKKMRTIFFITAFYFASHVILDMFGGGVVLFYPFYNEMAFIDASLEITKKMNYYGHSIMVSARMIMDGSWHRVIFLIALAQVHLHLYL